MWIRMHPAADADLARDPIDRAAPERALHLHARLPLAAPCQRNRNAAAWTKPIDEAHARAVGEAVTVFGAQDWQEHAARQEPPRRVWRHVIVERIHTGKFIDDDHQQDVVGVVDRAKALADLDAIELTAVFEALGHLGDERIGGRLADHFADDRHHLVVGRGVIAVDAYFADDTWARLRVGRRRAAQQDQ